MTNDAFALSPISARATQPSEEDYDAISEAFMETARGRWFLGEYAKRNRNADTRMVLDVVERIERSLEAQKQPEPAPVPDTSLADALSAIKAALSEARAAASGVVDELALDQHLAPVRKGARVIREISWRWREIGADSRICDLIDSQVSAIEASCGEIATADPRAGLSAAFDLIDRTVAAFDDSADAPLEAEVATVAASAAQPPAEALSARTLSAETVSTETLAAGTMSVEAEQPAVVANAVDDVDTDATATEATGMAVAATLEAIDEAAAEIMPDTADAEDEALLDMIAAEMGAPDLSDDSEYYSAALAETQTAEMQPAEVPSADPAPAEAEIETPATPLPIVRPLPPSTSERAPEPSLAPSPEPEASLGSTLIANGFLSKPRNSAPDPLAPLRRLTQVEKIALFS